MINGKDYKDKKYNDDTIFNCINKHHISLKDSDIKSNNVSLHGIINKGLIPLMKEDDFFKDTFNSISYAGSYFKGTKVGKPNEYDLDMVIRLPLNYRTLKVETNINHCGFIKIKVDDISKLPKWETHSKILNKWLDSDGYLDQNLFRREIEKILQKTYNKLNKVNNNYELQVDGKLYILKQFRKSGPAFTIYIKSKDDASDDEMMDVDLVPCLEFDDIILKGYKFIENMIKQFIVVPKPIDKIDQSNRLWRLSFYKQEKQILVEKEVGKLKPIIRMVKKFRDKQNWKKIASYYIETLFLHELTKRKSDPDFLRSSQTCLFIHMMKELQKVLSEKRLPYFWHENYNLLNGMDNIAIENYACALKNILVEIDKKIVENKFIIAEKLLAAEEVESLRAIICPSNNSQQVKKVVEVNANGSKSELVKNDTDTTDSAKSINIEQHIEPIKKDASTLTNSVESIDIKKHIESIKKDASTLTDLVESINIEKHIEPIKNDASTSTVLVESINIEKHIELIEKDASTLTDSVKSISIEKRVDQICSELTELMKSQEELSPEQFKKLRTAWMNINDKTMINKN